MLGVDLDAEGDLGSLDIPLPGAMDFSSSLQGDVSCIQAKGDAFLFSRSSNAEDVFRLALCGLENLTAPAAVLHSGLRSEA